MAVHRITPEEAFARLVTRSQHANQKPHAVNAITLARGVHCGQYLVPARAGTGRRGAAASMRSLSRGW
jgi:hypothetical protein